MFSSCSPFLLFVPVFSLSLSLSPSVFLCLILSPQVKQFAVNDVVKVVDDIAAVHDLQTDHGGWVDDMALVSKYFLSQLALKNRLFVKNAKNG